jgi:hypothetical protein
MVQMSALLASAAAAAGQSEQRVLGLLANLKQHARLNEVCLVEATSDNDLSVERNSMSN